MSLPDPVARSGGTSSPSMEALLEAGGSSPGGARVTRKSIDIEGYGAPPPQQQQLQQRLPRRATVSVNVSGGAEADGSGSFSLGSPGSPGSPSSKDSPLSTSQTGVGGSGFSRLASSKLPSGRDASFTGGLRGDSLDELISAGASSPGKHPATGGGVGSLRSPSRILSEMLSPNGSSGNAGGGARSPLPWVAAQPSPSGRQASFTTGGASGGRQSSLMMAGGTLKASLRSPSYTAGSSSSGVGGSGGGPDSSVGGGSSRRGLSTGSFTSIPDPQALPGGISGVSVVAGGGMPGMGRYSRLEEGSGARSRLEVSFNE